MNFRIVTLFLFSIAVHVICTGQSRKADSTAIAAVLHKLLKICRTVDFADPKTSQLGMFYKAAPYIIYQGEDKSRKWKSFANYALPADKRGVDQVCERINQSANQDSIGYKIVEYRTERESEGVWHVLLVKYKKNDRERTSAFAFLKLGNKFGLGDID
jgi:hypothetical protein